MVRPKVCRALVATFSITLGASLGARVLRVEVVLLELRGTLRRI